MQRTITNNPRRSVIEIKYRSEGKVDAAGAQFGSQYKAGSARCRQPGGGLLIVALAQAAHGG